MKREEIYKIVENKQKVEAESIYQLTVRYYGDEIKSYRKKINSEEWYYKISKIYSFYSTKEIAENALREYIQPEEIIHSALIERIAVNLPLGSSNVLEWWLFDKHGNEIDKSVCTSLLKNPMEVTDVYFGRQASQLRFNVGDIVEVIRNDRVYLEVLCGLPPMVDDMWRKYQDHMSKISNNKFPTEYFENCFSDCYYYVQSDGYGSDVPSFNVLPPTFTIPKIVKETLTSRFNLLNNK